MVVSACFGPGFIIRNSSGISGGFRQLRKCDSDVMPTFVGICDAARMNTGVNRQAEGRHSARQLIPRKLVRRSRRDTKEEDVIYHHSAHCRQILSIKTPLSSPSKVPNHLTCGSCSLCLWKARGFVFVCVASDRTSSKMATWPLRPRHDDNLLRWGGVQASCPIIMFWTKINNEECTVFKNTHDWL